MSHESLHRLRLASFTLILVSLVCLVASYSLVPYHNEKEYKEQYSAIDWELDGSELASDQFYRLRKSHLSLKYPLQDYGLSFFILGISGLVFFKKGKNPESPRSRVKILLLGISASILSVAAYIGDLSLEYERGAFPWWADSMEIPMIVSPFLLLITLLWAGINSLGMFGSFNTGVPLGFKSSHLINLIYLSQFLCVAFFAIVCLFEGFFWMILPSTLWMYFFLSLKAGR